MGREIKRVALDFAWELNEVWPGYLNHRHESHCSRCAGCAGSGYSPVADWWYKAWYGNVPFEPQMVGRLPYTPDYSPIRLFAERQCRHTPGYYGSGETSIKREAARLAKLFNSQWSHHLTQSDVNAWVEYERRWDPECPNKTAEEVNAEGLVGGFGGPSAGGPIRARCQSFGVEEYCGLCRGDGNVWDSPESKQAAEDWRPTEPPVGEGWQMWETVSEGSPVTPVFNSAEGLIEWIAQHGDGNGGWGLERARAFVSGPGWVPSGMIVDGQILRAEDIALYLETNQPTEENK